MITTTAHFQSISSVDAVEQICPFGRTVNGELLFIKAFQSARPLVNKNIIAKFKVYISDHPCKTQLHPENW